MTFSAAMLTCNRRASQLPKEWLGVARICRTTKTSRPSYYPSKVVLAVRVDGRTLHTFATRQQVKYSRSMRERTTLSLMIQAMEDAHFSIKVRSMLRCLKSRSNALAKKELILTSSTSSSPTHLEASRLPSTAMCAKAHSLQAPVVTNPPTTISTEKHPQLWPHLGISQTVLATQWWWKWTIWRTTIGKRTASKTCRWRKVWPRKSTVSLPVVVWRWIAPRHNKICSIHQLASKE